MVRDYINTAKRNAALKAADQIIQIPIIKIDQGGNIMAFGIGVVAVSAIISYEIEKRLPSVKKN